MSTDSTVPSVLDATVTPPPMDAAQFVATDEVRRWVALLSATHTMVENEGRASAERQARATALAALISRALDETVVRHDAMWMRLRGVEVEVSTLRLREAQSRRSLNSLEDVASSQQQVVARERAREIDPGDDTPHRRTAFAIVDQGIEEARELLEQAELDSLSAELALAERRLQAARDLLADTKLDIESLRTLADQISLHAKQTRDQTERFDRVAVETTSFISLGKSSAMRAFGIGQTIQRAES